MCWVKWTSFQKMLPPKNHFTDSIKEIRNAAYNIESFWFNCGWRGGDGRRQHIFNGLECPKILARSLRSHGKYIKYVQSKDPRSRTLDQIDWLYPHGLTKCEIWIQYIRIDICLTFAVCTQRHHPLDRRGAPAPSLRHCSAWEALQSWMLPPTATLNKKCATGLTNSDLTDYCIISIDYRNYFWNLDFNFIYNISIFKVNKHLERMA